MPVWINWVLSTVDPPPPPPEIEGPMINTLSAESCTTLFSCEAGIDKSVLRRRDRAGLDDIELAAGQRRAVLIELLGQGKRNGTSHY
jgi:hypothetical protein